MESAKKDFIPFKKSKKGQRFTIFANKCWMPVNTEEIELRLVCDEIDAKDVLGSKTC